MQFVIKWVALIWSSTLSNYFLAKETVKYVWWMYCNLVYSINICFTVSENLQNLPAFNVSHAMYHHKNRHKLITKIYSSLPWQAVFQCSEIWIFGNNNIATWNIGYASVINGQICQGLWNPLPCPICHLITKKQSQCETMTQVWLSRMTFIWWWNNHSY